MTDTVEGHSKLQHRTVQSRPDISLSYRARSFAQVLGTGAHRCIQTTSTDMVSSTGGIQLGAHPPEIILKSLNAGLTTGHLEPHHCHFYTFTSALVDDIREVFRQQHANGWFMCEMGSQEKDKGIDQYLETRCEAQAAGTLKTPSAYQDCAFCDNSRSLKDYLQQAVLAAGLEHLEVISVPPYAYIGDPSVLDLSVSPPERFKTIPGKNRFGVRFTVKNIPTGDVFAVICVHSPSSDNCDKLQPKKKIIIFHTCMQQAGVQPQRTTTHGAQ